MSAMEGPGPTRGRIAAAAAIAAAVAAVLLVTVVLPAEYGRDPLGTGRALGLLALYEAGVEETPPEAATGDAPAADRPRTYATDTWRLELKPRQAFEYKYRLEKGAAMVYAWRTTIPVKYEFHGEPDDRTLEVVSYEKREGDRASGQLVADFTGIHGWYWDNPSDETVTIAITSAGFFSSVEELRPVWDPEKHKSRIERIPHALTAVE